MLLCWFVLFFLHFIIAVIHPHHHHHHTTGKTSSRLASVVLYCFRKATLSLLRDFMADHPLASQRHFGDFMEWLVPRTEVYSMKLPDHFMLIGNVGLADYKACLQQAKPEGEKQPPVPMEKKVYARVGLVGNPSDGFFGKTISLSIENFWAKVTIVESDRLVSNVWCVVCAVCVCVCCVKHIYSCLRSFFPPNSTDLFIFSFFLFGPGPRTTPAQ